MEKILSVEACTMALPRGIDFHGHPKIQGCAMVSQFFEARVPGLCPEEPGTLPHKIILLCFWFSRSSSARTLPHGPQHSASKHQAATTMTTDKNQKLENGNGRKTSSFSNAADKNPHFEFQWTKMHI